MSRTRSSLEQEESRTLAPYALRSSNSRGRRVAEPEDPHRPAFARDRDRILHSGAFRRLEYKTQVVTSGGGDTYRTRLTHTLEVSQIARSLARALGLNETVVEALALAHDLGHPPFGHTGEHVLKGLMEGHGGFEHNVQALRVVDLLEQPYPGRPGLNLCFEIRESVLKHGPDKAGPLGAEFPVLPQPWLETQAVDLADSIAYHSHDVDDGLRFGVFTVAELDDLELWVAARESAAQRFPDARPDQLLRPTIHQTLQLPILDLLEESGRRLDEADLTTAMDARVQPRRLISFSEKMARMQMELKRFLFARFYRAERVERERERARLLLRELFEELLRNPERLPASAHQRLDDSGESLHRVVCDHVAGMTDRFAVEEHARCVGGSSDDR